MISIPSVAVFAAETMAIVPNLALAIVLVIPFLFTMGVLHFVLFKPMVAYLEERRAHSATARKEARALAEQIDDRLDTLKGRLEAARSEVSTLRGEARVRMHEKEAEIIAAARGRAEDRVTEAIVEIRAQSDAAAAALRETTNALAADIASKALGRDLEGVA